MASKESTTQPVICCLGQSVAGQPTQFLLDRAFASMRLQWQALSVEVRPEKFSLVCEAMLEMGFRGLRFYDPIATSACEQFANPTSLERFVGTSTSAFMQNVRWQVWDNLGYGWLELLKQKQVDAVWLHGDSRTTRSVFAAIASSSLNWLWTDAPSQLNSDLQMSDAIRSQLDSRVLIASVTPNDTGSLAKQFQEKLGCQTHSTSEDSETPVKRLALIAEQLPESLATEISTFNIELVASSELRLPELLSAKRFAQLSPADIAVAAEAYDFQRWTGKAIDISILRDAYDEYCDF